MNRHAAVPVLLLLALGGTLMAACSATARATTGVAGETLVGTTTAPPVSTQAMATDPAGPILGEPPTPRPVRTALEATDPTTVVLASGRPTLLEFFAFW